MEQESSRGPEASATPLREPKAYGRASHCLASTLKIEVLLAMAFVFATARYAMKGKFMRSDRGPAFPSKKT